MALLSLFALFVAYPYLIGDTHSLVANLIHSLMFFLVFVALFVVPFRFVYCGGSFGRGVLLVWCLFVLQVVFLGICYASSPHSLGLPQPDFRGVIPALFLGWLPGVEQLGPGKQVGCDAVPTWETEELNSALAVHAGAPCLR